MRSFPAALGQVIPVTSNWYFSGNLNLSQACRCRADTGAGWHGIRIA